MNQTNLLRQRLLSQQLVHPQFTSPEDIVSWMGAMQAQDYGWVRWALGIRLRRPSLAAVKTAFDEGRIIRLHLNRMTWQVVASDDVRPLLALYEKKNTAILRGYMRTTDLEYSDNLILSSESMLREVLKGGLWKTKEELAMFYQSNGFPFTKHALYCLLAMAEVRGVICSGGMDGRKCHYALLDGRVPQGEEYTLTEALILLADRYFQSHAPATLEDFVW